MYDAAIGKWSVVDKKSDDVNQVDKSPYQYSWNNPINLTDPDGNCPWCIGAVVGALVDVAVQAVEISLDDNKTIDDFSFASVGVSALAGATGVGLATKLKKVSTVAKLGIEVASDAAAGAGTQLAKEGKVDSGDLIIDVVAGQTTGKIAGDFAESKFLQSNKGKRLQEGINQQKNAERGKSNTISKSKSDVKGAERKLTKAAAARAVGSSTAASGATSTTINEINKKLNHEKEE